jgi:hypothetical protein
MHIASVIARRYWEGLELRSTLDAAVHVLLEPVLQEQMTDSSEWVCGPPRGWGGWIVGLKANANANCWGATSVRNMYYTQLMSNHLVIVRGLAESYRLLIGLHSPNGLPLLNDYPYYQANARFNLLASAAWVYQLGNQFDGNTGHGGAILDRWNNPLIDGTPTPYGTASGVQAVYEVLRSFDVQKIMPGYADYPASSPQTWTYEQLQAQTIAGVGYARDIQLFTGSQVYSDALYWQFGSGRRYGKALDRFIF